ncbi:MAG TPA: EamA family transporter [Thermoleophilaceae bacterium]|nr:EamA family transporter [Thermoleophilaceae bacterium]
MTKLDWVLPALGYVLVVGALGVLTKFALRQATWTDLIVSSALVYVVVAGALLATGSATLRMGSGGALALLVGGCAVAGLVLSTLALQHAEAIRVVPLMSTYPLVTVVLAVLLLSETVSLAQGFGIGFVIAGVVLLGR